MYFTINLFLFTWETCALLILNNSRTRLSAIWHNSLILFFSTCQILLFPDKQNKLNQTPQLYFCTLRNTKQFNIRSSYICKVETDISKLTLKCIKYNFVCLFYFIFSQENISCMINTTNCHNFWRKY